MDGFTSAVYDFIESALSILPDSPFKFLENFANSEMGQWFKWLNWFVPVNVFVSILEAWLACVIVYYVVQIVLRWAKAIE